ncbi:sensor histidine kinase [Massilia sp. BJB1822]|uniref:sensor histidine kinase n=1 Tax=Massilia sp. BJB1822 TaxID=2744470 RepID=UPI001592F8EF|nr:sensor histidine kinase [Massilia sp. BJB1822]NVD97346.1 PAS domain S-box protein [Massilia sp. BJB1822]
MSAARYRPGIGSYLAMAFCAMAVLLSVILSQVLGLIAGGQVKADIGGALAELALQTSDKLDRGMFERYREIELMSRRPDLRAPELDPASKRAILNERQATYQYYAWIGITDASGKVLAASQGMLEGANVAARPWFGKALQGTHVGDVHEALLLAKLLPGAGTEPKRFVDVAFPLLDKDGKAQGVLGAHLYWQWARDVEQSVIAPVQARRHVEALILGSDGTVLLGPPALQGRRLDLESQRAAHRQRSGHVVENWPDGGRYLVGYSETAGHAHYPGLGWTVLVRQGLDDAYQPLHQMQARVLWVGLGLALLFSLLGYLAALLIAQPLSSLAAAAERIRQGEALSLPPAAPYSEVQALVQALNALVANLMQRKSELNELNLTLERRVEQRTRELEQALTRVSANEQRVQTIIESAQDAFIAVDPQGRIIDWNSAAERMFGWRRSEVLGQSYIEVLVPPRFRARQEEAMLSFRSSGEANLPEHRLQRAVLRRNGEELAVEVTVALAGARDESFFSAFLRDVSAQRKVEQMKSEFISTVSHELRTPMTSIQASLAMLADGSAGELSPDTRHLLDIAQKSSERLVRLVNDVLDMEKIEAGRMDYQMRRQPILPLLEQALDAVRGMASQRPAGLQLEAAVDGVELSLDHDRIIQVLVNLLSNAVKFSPQFSTVTLNAERSLDWLTISVADQGEGIPPEFQASVFEKFAQADGSDRRRKGGTGLGLSICKSIVEAHGGRIGFETHPGKGTVFRVELPL